MFAVWPLEGRLCLYSLTSQRGSTEHILFVAGSPSIGFVEQEVALSFTSQYLRRTLDLTAVWCDVGASS